MKTVLTLFFCISLCIDVSAQHPPAAFEKPNYKRIDKAIRNKKSPFYYPLLMKRFQMGDSTLNISEKRYLYYGYMFQSDFNPSDTPVFLDSILIIFKKPRLNEHELNRVVLLSDSVLTKYPFSTRALSYQLYALKKLGKAKKLQARAVQLSTILAAIMSSGNGLSRDQAFFVIDPSHEYPIIDVVGFRFRGAQYTVDQYDILELQTNKAGVKGMFFEITPAIELRNKLFN